MKRIRTGFLAVFLLLSSSSNAWADLKVVCSISDYCALAKEIGGDRVDVHALALVGQDPHYVEPRPSFVMQLYRADLLISNGLELEIGWLPTLVLQARNTKIQKGATGRLIVADHVRGFLEVPTTKVDRAQGDVHPGGNPHFYHDPLRMKALIPVIVSRLSLLSPGDDALFKENGRKLIAQIKALMEQERARFGALPKGQRQIVTYHKSLSYLLDTLGLKAAAYVEPKPGVSPTPGHIARVLSLIKGSSVPVIVQELHYPQKTSATLAKIAKIRLVVIPGGTRPNQSYLEQVRSSLESIYQALAAGEGR